MKRMPQRIIAGCEILTAVAMKSFVFWNIMSRSFRETSQLHLQSKASLAAYFTLISCLAYLSTVKTRVTCSSKCQLTFNRLKGLYSRRQNIPVHLSNHFSCPDTECHWTMHVTHFILFFKMSAGLTRLTGTH
jgi:hypothetical protein